jgi:hypothetical protein
VIKVGELFKKNLQEVPQYWTRLVGFPSLLPYFLRISSRVTSGEEKERNLVFLCTPICPIGTELYVLEYKPVHTAPFLFYQENT